MIPSSFDYVVAKSVAEAVKLLGQHGPEAKVLAGGHSLIPLMKLRLAAPSVLVDIGKIPELRFIREEGDDIVVGGATTYYMLETSPLIAEKAPLLAMCSGHVGDVQVRNRGTIGGSLAHADPASDIPAAILALDARMKLVGPGGTREVPAGSFFVGMLQSAVKAGEILSEIRVKKAGAREGAAYFKVAQAASGFALVGIATSLALEDGKCANIRIGVTGVAATPFRATAAESRLRGKSLDPESLRSASEAAIQGVEALSDIHASDEYRKALAVVYTRRSIEAASAHASR
jgi:aerobic carbon-monoxide dehydrogenase medium subunit